MNPDRYQALNHERRFRLYTIPYHEVLDLLEIAVGKTPGTLAVPSAPRQLPEGAMILDSALRPEMREFQFLVAHESFDPVPVGYYPPRWPEPLRIEKRFVEVKTESTS